VKVDVRTRAHHELLQVLYTRGREMWPAVELDFEAFTAFAASKLEDGPLEKLRGNELYLVAGCIAQIEQAIIALDAYYLSPIAARMARHGYDAAAADDALQALRLRLLVAEPGQVPRLARYNGRGSLAIWLRVVATRIAINARCKQDREISDEIDVLAAEPSLELEVVRRRFGAEFPTAFRRAFEALSSRDRALLRYQVIERVGIDRVAAIYGIHRATAARWMAHARQSLSDGVRSVLQVRLRVSRDELDSVLRVVHSEFELSPRLLMTPSAST
jgi:RNA polymerase sigma-70 factor, ECF subfamily